MARFDGGLAGLGGGRLGSLFGVALAFVFAYGYCRGIDEYFNSPRLSTKSFELSRNT